MAKIKDTDYLAISARIRAMETTLLTAERMERLLEARSGEEVSKLLQECGYPELDAARPEAMDAALSQAREALLADLGDSAPDSRYIDIFKLKYDYHNAKAVLKAAAVGTDPARMFMDMGRIPASELKSAMESSELDTLPGLLPEAVAEAKNVLDTTRDPQLSDITLDGWMYRDMARTAERTGSAFLRGYVAAQIDAANLRSLIRTLRMGKNAGFLAGALLEGGETEPAALLAVAENAGLSVNQVLADRQANLFETISRIYTADQMQNFLMDEVAVPVMDLLTEFRQSSSSELVKNVLALIKQTRGDITLNECADRLNYNPSYIWKVLRTEKDTSFSDLANNEKLEMAKELLLTSDMTVVQIAETLNYSNVQNFIRFFSKKVGMTPGKYRKDYQNEKK